MEQIYSNSFDEYLQRFVENTREKLEELEDIKVTDRCIQVRIKWKDKGNTMNKDFFFAIKEPSTTSFIITMKDWDGNIFIDSKDMEATCYEFYQALYKAPTPIHQTKQTMKENLEQIPTKFIDRMNKVLQMPIIEPKFLKATKAMVRGKSLGSDGVVIKFYM
jgi:hypothetical protein